MADFSTYLIEVQANRITEYSVVFFLTIQIVKIAIHFSTSTHTHAYTCAQMYYAMASIRVCVYSGISIIRTGEVFV